MDALEIVASRLNCSWERAGSHF